MSNFLAPQGYSAGIFASNPVNSFAARPDLVNAAAAGSQLPSFTFGAGQSQPPSMLFPTANHGASQPIGFGSANTAYTNPLFGFSNWSSVAANPAVFGTPATYAPVAQYSFVTPFAACLLYTSDAADE